MLRPRESRDLRLMSSEVKISPAAALTHSQDVMGNSVAAVVFGAPADTLVIDSVALLHLDAELWPVFDVAASAMVYPFQYADNERTDLGALLFSNTPIPRSDCKTDLGLRQRRRDGHAGAAQGFLRWRVAMDQLSEPRSQGGQSPIETLDRGWGSCRDFAVLFVEAARCLGFGARIVSGYLFVADPATIGSGDAGSTHAWVEVYVPGAGWVTLDPTNRSVGGLTLFQSRWRATSGRLCP